MAQEAQIGEAREIEEARVPSSKDSSIRKEDAAMLAETDANEAEAKLCKKRRTIEKETRQNEAGVDCPDSNIVAKKKDKLQSSMGEAGAQAQAQADGGDTDREHLTVFVGGLPLECTDVDLQTLFSGCGGIEGIQLPTHGDGRRRGIAFMKFRKRKGVLAAVKLDGQVYNGRHLKVAVSIKTIDTSSKDIKDGGSEKRPRQEDSNKNKVVVGGLGSDTKEAYLRKKFSECGEIIGLQMPLNEEGAAKGIAFISFESSSGLANALKFHGKQYRGKSIWVNKVGDKGKGKGNGKGKKKEKGQVKGTASVKGKGATGGRSANATGAIGKDAPAA